MASKQRSLLTAFLLFFFSSPLITESHSVHLSHVESGQKHQPFQFLKELEGCHKGEGIQGLGQLKQYLHKFGYLPQYSATTNNNELADANKDDYFDDLLEKAITTYQINYHLNATGALDAQTVKQMMMPRCGVPDIKNGRTSMRSGKKRHNRGLSALHTVSRYSFFSGGPKWPSSKTHLTYGFIPGPQPVDADTFKSICSRAFGKWSSVSHFTFEEIQDYSAADIKIRFASGDHGDGSPFDGPGGTLAHAFAPTRGWFHMDADEKWGLSLSSDAFDVESVTLHEIGHLLGLGHSSVQDAVMFSSIPPGTTKVVLHGDDVQGIQALYST